MYSLLIIDVLVDTTDSSHEGGWRPTENDSAKIEGTYAKNMRHREVSMNQ